MPIPDVAIERAVKHGKRVRKTLRRHEIPEWGEDGKPFVGYSRKDTLGERNKIWPFIIRDDMEAYAWTVAIRLLDEKGDRLFTDDDVRDLINGADGDVVIRVANEITASAKAAGELPNVEEAKGNSERTPTDTSSSSSPKSSAAASKSSN